MERSDTDSPTRPRVPGMAGGPPARFVAATPRDDPPRARADADPLHQRHLIVIGHPAPDSFVHAIARAYAAEVVACGQEAVVRDLYALGFDPLLKASERPGTGDFRLSQDVLGELAHVRSCSVVTLVYPIWFGMPPAAIIGYLDRVLGAGLSMTAIQEGRTHALLDGKQLALLTTSGSTKPWLAERGQWHGLRETFDFYLESIFSFAGCEHEHFDSIVAPLQPGYGAECLGRAAGLAGTMCARALGAARARDKRRILDGVT